MAQPSNTSKDSDMESANVETKPEPSGSDMNVAAARKRFEWLRGPYERDIAELDSLLPQIEQMIETYRRRIGEQKQPLEWTRSRLQSAGTSNTNTGQEHNDEATNRPRRSLKDWLQMWKDQYNAMLRRYAADEKIISLCVAGNDIVDQIEAVEHSTQDQRVNLAAIQHALNELHERTLSENVNLLPAPKNAMSLLIKRPLEQGDLRDGEAWVCAICSEEREIGHPITELPCHHSFGSTGLEDWLLYFRVTCPLCRRLLPSSVRNDAEAEHRHLETWSPQ